MLQHKCKDMRVNMEDEEFLKNEKVQTDSPWVNGSSFSIIKMEY